MWDIHFHCIYSRKFSINELIKSDVKIYIIRFQSQQADKIYLGFFCGISMMEINYLLDRQVAV